MEAAEGSTTPPKVALLPGPIPIMGGARSLTVRPWTMETQDETMPLVAALVDRWLEWNESNEKATTFSLGALLLNFHREVSVICERSVRDELRDMGIVWKDLWGDDIYAIAQAVWLTSIMRADGGGMVGKGMALLGPILLLRRGADRSSDTTPQSDPDQRPSNGSSVPSSSPA